MTKILSLEGQSSRGSRVVDEFGDIRQSCLDAKANLQRVRRELRPLRKRLKQLEHEEATFQFQMNRLKTALALPNRLPTEILRDIFKLCQDEVANSPPRDTDCTYAISRVCSRWRQIALAVREFWSSLRLHTPAKKRIKITFVREVEIIREWLSRANGIPISITSVDITDGEMSHLWNAIIIQNVLPDFQCRELKIYIRPYQLKDLKHIIHRSAAVLDKLVLNFVVSEQDYGWPRVPSICSEFPLPKLTSLQLVGSWDHRNLLDFPSWNNMVQLSVDTRLELSQCFDVLHQCHTLEFCDLFVAKNASIQVVPEIILPGLRVLNLTVDGDSLALKKLVQALTTPRLMEFLIEPSVGSLRINFADLEEMFERSGGCNLDNFAIGMTFDSLDPGAILNLAPNIRYLHIHNGVLSEKTIQDISRGQVARKLTHITLKSAHDPNQILRMIKQRNQNTVIEPDDGSHTGSTPLEVIIINCMRENLSIKEKKRIRLKPRSQNLAYHLGNINRISLTNDTVNEKVKSFATRHFE